MRILIGTKNPGKIEGAKLALEKYFDNVNIIGVDVKSQVPEQPVNEDILLGAKNRIKNLKQYAHENNIIIDMYLAIESGISDQLGNWFIINYAVIDDDKGCESVGIGPAFPVPNKYVNDIINRTLGVVMDEIFNAKNLSKHNGGISELTKGYITRINITKEAFTMALTKYINDFWKD